MSTQVHHLNKLCRARVTDAVYQVRSMGLLLLEKKVFLRIFTIYGHGSHLGHMTRIIWTNFRFPIPLKLHMKFGFNWPSSFWADVWRVWATDGLTDDDKDDRWTMKPAYSISSPMSLTYSSWEDLYGSLPILHGRGLYSIFSSVYHVARGNPGNASSLCMFWFQNKAARCLDVYVSGKEISQCVVKKNRTQTKRNGQFGENFAIF